MSPSNVLVSYAGEVKIADFGIAKAEARAYTTQGGVLKGKFEYMSPEQARGEMVTQLSDIFSTGIVLWEMLTGRRLFKTSSEIKTLEKIKSLDFGAPSTVNPNIPGRLDNIVMKALAGDPVDRFQSAQEFQAALLDYMYPSTPTVIARSLARFMEELFAEEREQERIRLEAGSVVALQLREQPGEIDLEAEWEETTGRETLTTPTQRNRGPLVVAIAAILGMLVLSGLLVFTMSRQEESNPAPSAATEVVGGRLTVKIAPPIDANVYLGEVLQGTGSTVVIRNLETGEITVRVEAEGYVTATETVEVEKGVRTQITIVLTIQGVEESGESGSLVVTPPALKTVPTPVLDTHPSTGAPSQATTEQAPGVEPEPLLPSTLRFESSPTGATIRIDGARYAKTPASFEAVPGQSYRVTYQLDGYESTSFTTKGPDSETTDTVSRSLKKKVVALGKINVNVRAGWANVYIDGKDIGKSTPLFGHQLTVGTHKVRVVNEQQGLDETKTVTVTADGVQGIAF
jgi:serine/threonine-protein kinase